MPRADPRWKDESHPRSGVEFDWLGVDLQGHVAVFTTAGFGPVPMQVDQHLDDVDAALDRVGQLPVIGSAGDIGRRSADGDYSDWNAYSAKGFYAYDWEDQGSRYQRLSSPAVPISVSQLPAEIRAVAQFAEFPVKFADEPEIIIWDDEPRGRFLPETAEMLSEAGWFPGRDVFSQLRLPAEFTLFPAAQRVLQEFGMLRIGRKGPGLTSARTPVVLDPMLCVGEDDRFSDCASLLHSCLYPLGETADGHAFVAIDDRGRVFLMMDTIWFVGDTFDGALDSLLRGERRPEVDETGKPQSS
jgi:hypothetical protein